jgi:hypothetical protein
MGLQRKAHRKRMGASEDLERKARFFCPPGGKKMRNYVRWDLEKVKAILGILDLFSKIYYDVGIGEK